MNRICENYKLENPKVISRNFKQLFGSKCLPILELQRIVKYLKMFDSINVCNILIYLIMT